MEGTYGAMLVRRRLSEALQEVPAALAGCITDRPPPYGGVGRGVHSRVLDGRTHRGHRRVAARADSLAVAAQPACATQAGEGERRRKKEKGRRKERGKRRGEYNILFDP